MPMTSPWMRPIADRVAQRNRDLRRNAGIQEPEIVRPRIIPPEPTQTWWNDASTLMLEHRVDNRALLEQIDRIGREIEERMRLNSYTRATYVTRDLDLNRFYFFDSSRSLMEEVEPARDPAIIDLLADPKDLK